MLELLKKPISFIKFSLPLWAIIAIVLALILIATVIIVISAKNNAKKAKNPKEIKLRKQDKIVADFESKHGIVRIHDVPQLPAAVEITTLPNPEIFQPSLTNDKIVMLDKKEKIKKSKANKISGKQKSANNDDFMMPKKYNDNIDELNKNSGFSKSQVEQFISQVNDEDDEKLVSSYFNDNGSLTKNVSSTNQDFMQNSPQRNFDSYDDDLSDFENLTTEPTSNQDNFSDFKDLSDMDLIQNIAETPQPTESIFQQQDAIASLFSDVEEDKEEIDAAINETIIALEEDDFVNIDEKTNENSPSQADFVAVQEQPIVEEVIAKTPCQEDFVAIQEQPIVEEAIAETPSQEDFVAVHEQPIVEEAIAETPSQEDFVAVQEQPIVEEAIAETPSQEDFVAVHEQPIVEEAIAKTPSQEDFVAVQEHPIIKEKIVEKADVKQVESSLQEQPTNASKNTSTIIPIIKDTAPINDMSTNQLKQQANLNVDTECFEDFDEENPLEDDTNLDELDFEENQQETPKYSNAGRMQKEYQNQSFMPTEQPYYNNKPTQYPYNSTSAKPYNETYTQPNNAPYNYYTPPYETQNNMNYGEYPNHYNTEYQNNYAPQYKNRIDGYNSVQRPINAYPNQMMPPYPEYSSTVGEQADYYREMPYAPSNRDSGYKQGSFKAKNETTYLPNENMEQNYNSNFMPQYPNQYFGYEPYPNQAPVYYNEDLTPNNYFGYPANYTTQNYQNDYPTTPPNNQYNKQSPQFQGMQNYNDKQQTYRQPIDRQPFVNEQPFKNQPNSQQQFAPTTPLKPVEPIEQNKSQSAPVIPNQPVAPRLASKPANYKLRQPIIQKPSLVQIIPLTNAEVDEKRGRFRIIQDIKNTIRPYKFQLVTKNNQVLFESQSFKVKPRIQQIDAFRKIITTGAFEFNQEPNGAYRFNLLTANQRLCGVGDMYKNIESAEKAALATKKYGLAANYIEDITNAQ